MATISESLRPALCSCLIVVAAVGASGGCGSVKTTGTTRTGTEQLLLTNAWDSALQRVDFRPLTGVPVYLDTTNVTAVDQGWVVSSLRQALLTQGVLLRTKPEQAQWVVEARVGAYGTDEYNWMVGIPQTNVPTLMPGLPAGTIPKMPLVENSKQQAVAKLALFAYDRGSGQIVWNSGTVLATANAKDVFVAGFGPIQSGSIRGGTNVVGIRIPLTADTPSPDVAGRPRQGLPFSTPAIQTPATLSDVDSFSP
jgi:hypothetical protein